MNGHRDELVRPSDTDLLARFIWNEARDERLQGKLAVAHVVMNRVKTREYYGDSIQDVILKSEDFKGLKGDNRLMVRTPIAPSCDREFALCKAIAELATRGHLKNDPTGGATHFHRVTQKPSWASKLIFQRQIGNHFFYRDPLMRSIEDHSLQPQALAVGRQP
jgi:N-acetylmuramoyl-L-alanine amidase